MVSAVSLVAFRMVVVINHSLPLQANITTIMKSPDLRGKETEMETQTEGLRGRDEQKQMLFMN